MSSQIQIRRGLQANLPSSAALGELLFATDTQRMYVGTGTGIVFISGTFVYTQNTPSTTWNVSHYLGKFPSVTVIDSAGTQVFGDINQIDSNHLVIQFSAPFAGTVYLN